jgi:2-keto-4-pentenoate hydratase/2-oxohepta-3-ene-1,7-dioic acid hydratase in catechol pathway
MKLMRLGPVGRERLAVLDRAGLPRDLQAMGLDLNPDSLSAGVLDEIRTLDPENFPLCENDRPGAIVGRPGKIVGIGLNYAEHAREAGAPPPSEPAFFLKAPTSLAGANDPILLPPGASKLDFEVELAVVIGRAGRHIPVSAAHKFVAGYATFNDVSERAYQLEMGTQWSKGKSYDSFAPIGPYLVTPDEFSAEPVFSLVLEVNGETRQVGSTADMVHSVRHLIAYCSRFFSWSPGDILATGTPAGVAHGASNPVYLRPDDVVSLELSGLGRQTHVVKPDQIRSIG